MMVFTSVYGVVDGFFVSNYAGLLPFAAVNFIMPFLMILGTIGFMLGTGGSALIAISMGEGDYKKATRLFSLFVYATIIIGALITVLGIIYVRDVAYLLGARGEMLRYCEIYGKIILVALVPYMLMMEFQSFFVTAQKPNLGLIVTIISGVCNMVLDALFVAVFRWGVYGAAVATSLSQIVGGVIAIVYFILPNKSPLRLGKTNFDAKAMMRACTNGSSELMTNVSMSLVNMLYNFQLMKYAGEMGVASYGVLMYVNFIFISVFIGYSIGTAPIFSFHYGAKHHDELRSLLKKSMVIIGIVSVGMFVMCLLLADPFSYIFSSGDNKMYTMTANAFFIVAFSFLFSGVAIFGSSYFTSLGNGLISALISFLRTLVFQVLCVMVMPLVLGIDGIWASVTVAEGLACVVAVIFIYCYRKKYLYSNSRYNNYAMLTEE